MKITYISDQGVGKLNEDQYLLSTNLFAVVDGATSSSGYVDENGKTGGLLAATIAKDVFQKNDAPLAELAVRANDKLRSVMHASNIDTSNPNNLWAASLAAVRIIDTELEWLQIGDCMILLINEKGDHRLLGNTINYDMPALLQWKELAGKQTENISRQIQPLLKDEPDVANTKLAVLNGDPRMQDLMHHGNQSLSNIKHILLFTDGLLIPQANPSIAEDLNAFVKLYLKGGLERLKNHVRNLEVGDPNCWQYPRFKQHDDMTAIAVEL